MNTRKTGRLQGKPVKPGGLWLGRVMPFVLLGSLTSAGAFGEHLDVSGGLTGISSDCHGAYLGKQVPGETLTRMLAAHARWLADHQDPKGVQADL
ncbi:MAG: hypothetical protein KC594_17870, partial [Nitrospira sp.]|nr:hypothetical protein [Nitrospira sp.]